MKPILFNTKMVRAILDGRKMVTRRVVKPQPRDMYHDGKLYEEDGDLFVLAEDQNGQCFQIVPPYRTGDILYVRETWAPVDGGGYIYRAGFGSDKPLWHPSIHMPREAARIFLRVTGVRVERLRDITEERAQLEGAKKEYQHYYDNVITAREVFRGIWDSTIKPADRAIYGWGANPWVWVIEFEQIPKPV